MPYTTIISAETLNQHLDDPDWAIIDSRFFLPGDPDKGWQDYQESHIAGAVYAHMNRDLSSPVIPGQTGRHPLPDVDTFAQTLSNWGIDSTVQVVVYDEMQGHMAARLWWMLRWLGHEAVAVLEGGWTHWDLDEYPTRNGIETRPARTFIPNLRPELLVSSADVLKMLDDPAYRLLDVRNEDRYQGKNETIDPVAGHIPGAVSAHFGHNLTPDGRFLSPEELQAHYRKLLGDVSTEQAVFYCGSGLTAAHGVLAVLHAGLGEARLYGGSWSDWITDPDHPIETGADDE